MENFKKLLQKLQPVPDPKDYVTDPYNERSMNEEIAGYSKQLSPEDVEKIHFAETSGGKFLKNPDSSASGHYQITDSTRKVAEKQAKDQEIDENTANPLRKDAILMKALVKKYENVLENAKKGPFEPKIENIDLLHKEGVTGGLRALGNPKTDASKAKFEEIKQRLAKKPKKKESNKKEALPAKDLLELLGEQ